MLLDIHHKYLGVTLITFGDIDFSKFPFFIRPHSMRLLIFDGFLVVLRYQSFEMALRRLLYYTPA